LTEELQNSHQSGGPSTTEATRCEAFM
jgi:hypothetical protein